MKDPPRNSSSSYLKVSKHYSLVLPLIMVWKGVLPFRHWIFAYPNRGAWHGITPLDSRATTCCMMPSAQWESFGAQPDICKEDLNKLSQSPNFAFSVWLWKIWNFVESVNSKFRKNYTTFPMCSAHQHNLELHCCFVKKVKPLPSYLEHCSVIKAIQPLLCRHQVCCRHERKWSPVLF